ncbi:putative membrane protein [Wickerhamomyces ciferrii]|uniref:Membrane protein n=1 Tax=Wickerhamomyces ciferrii (strain ATCC 14091 / BCRC 22168 / CBS 111 / JCM 3599 / NBRC 0793 / NRRL Y-1031 F-60-10) TaxID=1206466 RepID=K0KML3_WICCF|nr:uncharacterized protein BN7_1892 [Wickerhamomyces ciferrii]CCH42348.1 putative membrane protein [Wickerhamomyces ciferrii]
MSAGGPADQGIELRDLGRLEAQEGHNHIQNNERNRQKEAFEAKFNKIISVIVWTGLIISWCWEFIRSYNTTDRSRYCNYTTKLLQGIYSGDLTPTPRKYTADVAKEKLTESIKCLGEIEMMICGNNKSIFDLLTENPFPPLPIMLYFSCLPFVIMSILVDMDSLKMEPHQKDLMKLIIFILIALGFVLFLL